MSGTNGDTRPLEYPMFKGLQRPLEFMGIQGRYIYWAAGAIGGAIVGFIVAYCLSGFLAGLIVPGGDTLRRRGTYPAQTAEGASQ